MEEIAKAIIDKVPSWFIMLGCALYSIQKFCLANRGLLKTFLKSNEKLFFKIEKRLDHMEEKIDNNSKEILEIKKVNEEQTKIINNLK